jgi:hypothetical protein
MFETPIQTTVFPERLDWQAIQDALKQKFARVIDQRIFV